MGVSESAYIKPHGNNRVIEPGDVQLCSQLGEGCIVVSKMERLFTGVMIGIQFDDRENSIDVTEDQMVLVRRGSGDVFVQAKDLKFADRLRLINRFAAIDRVDRLDVTNVRVFDFGISSYIANDVILKGTE